MHEDSSITHLGDNIYANKNGIYKVADVQDEENQATKELLFYSGHDVEIFTGEDAKTGSNLAVVKLGEFEDTGKVYQEMMSHASEYAPAAPKKITDIDLTKAFNDASGLWQDVSHMVSQKWNAATSVIKSNTASEWAGHKFAYVAAAMATAAVGFGFEVGWGIAAFAIAERVFDTISGKFNKQAKQIRKDIENSEDPNYDIKDLTVNLDMKKESTPDLLDQDVLGRCTLMPFDKRLGAEGTEGQGYLPRKDVTDYDFNAPLNARQRYLKWLFHRQKGADFQIVWPANDGAVTTLETNGLLVDAVPHTDSVMVRIDKDVLRDSVDQLPVFIQDIISKVDEESGSSYYAFELERRADALYDIKQYYTKSQYKAFMAERTGNEAWAGHWTHDQSRPEDVEQEQSNDPYTPSRQPS